MCGRFTFFAKKKEFKDQYGFDPVKEISSSWNIAPAQPIYCLHKSNKLELKIMNWGFQPTYSSPPPPISPINARSEEILDKAFFQEAIYSRRCIIPANGFYEWRKTDKQAFYISPLNGLLSFAGIFNIHRDKEQNSIYSCAIITTKSNTLMQDIHDRMPLCIHQNLIRHWLDPKISALAIEQTLKSTPPQIQIDEVGPKVNRISNNSMDLIQKYQNPQGSLF